MERDLKEKLERNIWITRNEVYPMSRTILNFRG